MGHPLQTAAQPNNSSRVSTRRMPAVYGQASMPAAYDCVSHDPRQSSYFATDARFLNDSEELRHVDSVLATLGSQLEVRTALGEALKAPYGLSGRCRSAGG